MKDTTKAFFRQLLSVILGIIITFGLQSTAERVRTRRSVRAALELVKSELAANAEDIGVVSDYLRSEQKAAKYFYENRTRIDRCPADSISHYGGILYSDVSITLSQDALELLKVSSLFQKIGDNETSMKIIRAYDTCNSAATNFNKQIEVRNSMFDRSITEQNARRMASPGSINIKEFIKTGMGQYVISWLSSQPGPEEYSHLEDVETAIAAIDSYMSRKHR